MGADDQRRRTRPGTQDQAGFIYIFSLTIIMFLTVAGASMLLRGISESRLSTRSRDQSVAFQLADAAIDEAAVNLWTDSTEDDILSRTFGDGTFSIVSTVASGELVTVQTQGVASDDETRNLEAVIALTEESVFRFALFGDQLVTLRGDAITDSYDSDLGSYTSQTPGKEGDVGTNSTTNDGVTEGITVSGTSLVVNGQVVVGPGVTDFTDVVQGNVNNDFITGDPKYASQSTEFPMLDSLVVPPAGCETSLPSPQGNTTTLLSSVGEYCPSSDLLIDGGEFTSDGPVKIYVSGQLNIAGRATIGRFVGGVGKPADMIFLLSSTGEMTLNPIEGNSEFHGVVYGPNATVNVAGNAIVHGSIIAETVDLGGDAQIHYDVSLGDCDGSSPLPQTCEISNLNSTEVVSWREL